MKKLILTFIILVFMVGGCGSVKTPYHLPDGCLNDDGTQKESVILEYIEHPNETAMMLKLATTTIASEVEDDYVQEMINVIETANSMLENTTYSDIANYLIDNISSLRSEYSTQLMIITQYAQNMVNIDIPINECDRVLMKKHFNEQIVLLKSTLVK